METDSYVNQTKVFFHRCRHLVLSAIPLALMMAGALHGAAIFGTPTGTESSTSLGITGGAITGMVTNGGQSVSLYGTATLQSTSCSKVGVASTCDTATDGLVLDWSGSGSGTFSTATQPLDWDFTITGPGASSSTWTLTFTINPAGTPVVTTYTGDVGSGGGPVSSTFAGMNVPNGQSFTGYDVTLEVDTDFANETDVLTVNAPENTSVDIDPASVPEPASLFLSSIGVAALLGAKSLQKRARRP